MKVNLLFDNPGDVRSGYLNIDGAVSEEEVQGNPNDSRIAKRVDDLSHTVDANELDELVAMDILDYFPMNHADVILDHWLSRLKHGGELTLSVVDLRQISREVLSNALDISDVNHLLFGKQEKPWQFKNCVFTIHTLVEILGAKGYTIIKKLAVGNRAIVTVRRP